MSPAAAREILLNVVPGETRFAMVEKGVLRDIRIFRQSPEPRLSEIYLGRIKTILGGIDAAFVDLGNGQSGFLPLRGKPVHQGEAVLLRVIKEAAGEKLRALA